MPNNPLPTEQPDKFCNWLKVELKDVNSIRIEKNSKTLYTLNTESLFIFIILEQVLYSIIGNIHYDFQMDKT